MLVMRPGSPRLATSDFRDGKQRLLTLVIRSLSLTPNFVRPTIRMMLIRSAAGLGRETRKSQIESEPPPFRARFACPCRGVVRYRMPRGIDAWAGWSLSA